MRGLRHIPAKCCPCPISIFHDWLYLTDYPELMSCDVITPTKEMTAGNCWRLFCWRFSIIASRRPSALTLDIGSCGCPPISKHQPPFSRDLRSQLCRLMISFDLENVENCRNSNSPYFFERPILQRGLRYDRIRIKNMPCHKILFSRNKNYRR